MKHISMGQNTMPIGFSLVVLFVDKQLDEEEEVEGGELDREFFWDCAKDEKKMNA